MVSFLVECFTYSCHVVATEGPFIRLLLGSREETCNTKSNGREGLWDGGQGGQGERREGGGERGEGGGRGEEERGDKGEEEKRGERSRERRREVLITTNNGTQNPFSITNHNNTR